MLTGNCHLKNIIAKVNSKCLHQGRIFHLPRPESAGTHGWYGSDGLNNRFREKQMALQGA